jgi:hypothetical protein
MFNPQSEYEVTFKDISLRAFVDYKDAYVTRPPYQRKNVWSRARKQELLDSLFRRYYVPRIVIREVRLGEHTTRREVIDGQQRIITAQMFLENELPLPKSLVDIRPDLAGKYFKNLPPEVREFVHEELSYSADIVKGIEDPKDPEHQRIATEIFWRLQQGVSLNYMEEAHARLSSLSRNFVVHYADDIRFDYEAYKPVDENPSKHPFFKIVNSSNERMDHLSLLTRLLMLEERDGAADVRNQNVQDYIDRYQVDDGIDNLEFKDRPQAKAVLSNLNAFYDLFKGDPMIRGGDVVRELKREYFIISMYLLLRRLRNLYVFEKAERELFRRFFVDFHARWQDRNNKDTDILLFSDNRQQSANEIAVRHMILRQIFFEYVSEQGYEMKEKDTKRAFDESERILLYRMNDGLCQACLEEGKPRSECFVPWSQFDADHIVPHSKGGATTLDNAELLCRHHNQQKGASLITDARG